MVGHTSPGKTCSDCKRVNIDINADYCASCSNRRTGKTPITDILQEHLGDDDSDVSQYVDDEIRQAKVALERLHNRQVIEVLEGLLGLAKNHGKGAHGEDMWSIPQELVLSEIDRLRG